MAGKKPKSVSAAPPQYSVALSDLALSAASIYGAYLLHTAGSANNGALVDATIGVGSLGLAALAGTFRFAGVSALIPVHDFLTHFVPCVGFPLIGMALFGLSHLHWVKVALAVIYSGLALTQKPGVLQAYEGIVAGPSIISIGVKGFLTSGIPHLRLGSLYSIAGSAGILVAAAVGPTGTLFGVYRVNLFHYIMAAAICAVSFGAKELLQ